MRVILLGMLCAGFVQAAAVEVLQSGGDGCPNGSVNVQGGSDGQPFQMVFGEFAVAAAPGTEIRRAACTIAIRVNVPSGMQVGLSSMKFTGQAELPLGAKATINSEVFFAGGRSPVAAATLQGKYQQSYSLVTNVGANAWSGCGQSANLRVNASIALENKNGQGRAQVSMNKGTGSASQLGLEWRRCR